MTASSRLFASCLNVGQVLKSSVVSSQRHSVVFANAIPIEGKCVNWLLSADNTSEKSHPGRKPYIIWFYFGVLHLALRPISQALTFRKYIKPLHKARIVES